MDTASVLERLPATRRALLQALKKRGELGADELATTLTITPSAVRQHLAGLVADGLVAHRELKGGPGRPKHRYHLTPAAEGLFPKAYGELTNELLEYVEDSDPELLDRIFARRRQRRLEGARARLAGLPFDEKVRELGRILDEDGYLADVVDAEDGGLRIVEHNCAIFSVARKYGLACSTELDFIRAALPEAKVDRVKHMLAGAYVCAYDVKPKASKRSPAARDRGGPTARAPRC